MPEAVNTPTPTIEFTPIKFPIKVTSLGEPAQIPTVSRPYAEIFGDWEPVAAAEETLGPATAAEAGAMAGGLAVAGAVVVGVAAIAAAVVIATAISADNDKREKFTLQFVTAAS